ASVAGETPSFGENSGGVTEGFVESWPHLTLGVPTSAAYYTGFSFREPSCDDWARRSRAFAHQDDGRRKLSGASVDGRQPVAPRLARCGHGRSEGAGAGGPGFGDRRRAGAVRPQSSRNQRDGRLLHF